MENSPGATNEPQVFRNSRAFTALVRFIGFFMIAAALLFPFAAAWKMIHTQESAGQRTKEAVVIVIGLRAGGSSWAGFVGPGRQHEILRGVAGTRSRAFSVGLQKSAEGDGDSVRLDRFGELQNANEYRVRVGGDGRRDHAEMVVVRIFPDEDPGKGHCDPRGVGTEGNGLGHGPTTTMDAT